jgi:hypothetical protein
LGVIFCVFLFQIPEAFHNSSAFSPHAIATHTPANCTHTPVNCTHPPANCTQTFQSATSQSSKHCPPVYIVPRSLADAFFSYHLEPSDTRLRPILYHYQTNRQSQSLSNPVRDPTPLEPSDTRLTAIVQPQDSELTNHNSGEHKPTSHNSDDHKPTSHNTGEHKPTSHNSDDNKPTSHNSDEHKPTNHKSGDHKLTSHNQTKDQSQSRSQPLLKTSRRRRRARALLREGNVSTPNAEVASTTTPEGTQPHYASFGRHDTYFAMLKAEHPEVLAAKAETKYASLGKGGGVEIIFFSRGFM